MASYKQGRILALVIVLTLIWGTNWVLFPIAVEEVSVWTFRSICVLGAGSLLLLTAHLHGMSLNVPPRERKPLAMAGLTYLVIWNVASAYAATLLPSGQAAMLGFTMPIWASVFAWIFLRQKPTPRIFASLLLASFGVALLAFASRKAFSSASLGFFVGLSAGIGWAIGTTILKQAQVTVHPLVSTAWQLIIAGVPLALIAILLGSRELFMPSWTSIVVVGYITVVCMALGNVMWFYILDVLPVAVSGLAIVMVPIVAMLTGAFVHDEPLGAIQIAAILCCALAMGLVLLKPPSGR